MQYFINIIRKYWERGLCVFMAFLCVICFIAGTLFVLEEPERNSSEGSNPGLPRIMPWETLTDMFFSPPIPQSTVANPFHLVIENHLQPESVKKPAAKTEPVASKAETPKAVVPKQEPKKVIPPKPDRVITVIYKGYYQDVAGNVVALITISDTAPKGSETLMCKVGETLKDKITLKSVSEENAIFAVNDTEYAIPWKAQQEFHFKQE